MQVIPIQGYLWTITAIATTSAHLSTPPTQRVDRNRMKKDNIAKNYQNVCHWHHEAAQSLVQRHPGRVTAIKQVNKQMDVRE